MAKLIPPGDEIIYVKAAVHGASGSGKSSMGATSPRPLILMSEKQGRTPARKRAKELGRGQPTIVEVDSLQDYRDCVKALHGPKNEPFRWVDREGNVVCEMDDWPLTIVLDSLTDACELVVDDIRRDAPPKRGEDGLEVFSQRHWNELKKRCSRLIRAFRDAPVHVLFLSLLDEKVTETTDGTTTRLVGPMMPMRTLPDILMQATNVAGILTRRSENDPENPEGDKLLVWEVVTNGPAWVKVKPYRPLGDREVPDFASWVERIVSASQADVAEIEAKSSKGRRAKSSNTEPAATAE